MNATSGFLFALLGVLGASGCAVEGNEAEAAANSTEALESTDVSVASVIASGNCAAHGWTATLSPDAKTLTMTPPNELDLDATINPGQSMSIADCTLAIDLRMPSGRSVAVTTAVREGYVVLDQPGMRASETDRFYFQGNPIPANPQRSDMAGPFDDSFLVTENMGVVDQVWSPCGASRRVIAQTRLTVQNNASKSGSGYAMLKLPTRFGLSWRQC